MNNEPVAWMYESKNVDGKPYISDVSLKPLFGLVTRYGYKEIPLYTHPHPDNLGFALSIIDQQKLEIEELKQYTKKGNGLLAECDEHMGKLQALILKQDARIAELEKCAEYYRDKYYFDSPAKTLTDEGDLVNIIEKQQAEIKKLKEALNVKVILNEHAQQSMKEVKDLLRKAQEK